MKKLWILCILLCLPLFVSAEVARPFIWMNAADVAAAKERLVNEPWAKTSYERMFRTRAGGNSDEFKRLFDYMVRGDEAAGKRERDYLLTFIGAEVDHRPWQDQYLNALRYDIFHDELTQEERTALEETMRVHIQHAINWQRDWTRTSWLPNMQWPRKFSAHILALALQDEDLIREISEVRGSWKWYMNEYVADGGFYMEEFGKQYSMIGEMLLWCQGLKRLGMDELGFGYVGTGGGTMRRYLESYFHIGYPRTEIPGGLPQYPSLTHGDARGGPQYTFERGRFPAGLNHHAHVAGWLSDGEVGGQAYFMGANMNGRDHRWAIVEKMVYPLWFEIAHRQWPEGGFDYFLAQMRHPGDEMYLPSLFFGQDPVNPAEVTPPPAPSGLYRERGFAMLRAEEGPDYWASSAPAVSLLFSMYYVHYTHDSFALAGFHAHNRPLYVNRGISRGYAGDDPWTDSLRGHAGVVVDNLQGKFVDNGNEGTPNHRVRHDFRDPVRFVAIQAEGIYPDVHQERALFLTREYLLDINALHSDRPRKYDWNVHALGSHHPREDETWVATDELDGGVLYDRFVKGMADRLESDVGHRYDLREVRRLDAGDGGWSVDMVQDFAGKDLSQSQLGEAWYAEEIGVRVHGLGDANTTVYTGITPTAVGREFEMPETGGVTLLVRRESPSTVFTMLHEPFKGGPDNTRVRAFTEIAGEGDAMALRISGEGIEDRVLFRHGETPEEETTLTAENGESFTFASQAFVRVGAETLTATGDLRKLIFPAHPATTLTVNGEVVPTTHDNGFLIYARP
ncbi:MAG: hypothetical protein JJU29_09230 [Verrucomicrobia bacterium]|nr:hypothetical protein [Verrucomicrobiota bacterium]MCH8513147.1 hypothetical protein [Kiritimatiellia bacterium]